MFATDAVSPHKGGIALVWRTSPTWSLESERTHGPNIIRFELKTGHRRFLIVGAYISPSEEDGSTFDYIKQACNRQTGLCTIVMGDFHVDIVDPGATGRDAEILAGLAGLGVTNAGENFHLSRRHCDGFTWKQCHN